MGYKAVSLDTEDHKRIQRRVHRLCMYTFNYIPGCENLQVNHIDGNKFNNDISNLEWVTPKENIRHAINNDLRKSWEFQNNPKAKITVAEAITICNMILSGYSNEKILQVVPNANENIITQIAIGNSWKSLISQDQFDKMREIRYGGKHRNYHSNK